VALWYNKEILDAIGVEPPKTFEEVTPALAKVAAAGQNYLPLAMTGQPTNQGDWTAWPWMSGYGFSYDNLDQMAVEQAFTLVADWSTRGYSAKLIVYGTPLYWLVSTSFKASTDVFRGLSTFVTFEPTLAAYQRVWNADLLHSAFNSLQRRR
jgi:ABC-type glycerol-3-phosphate transport system substrate-binding protein